MKKKHYIICGISIVLAILFALLANAIASSEGGIQQLAPNDTSILLNFSALICFCITVAVAIGGMKINILSKTKQEAI